MGINEKTRKPVAYWSDIVKGPPTEVGKLWDFEGLKKPEVQKPGKRKAKMLEEEGSKRGEEAVLKAGGEKPPNQKDGEVGSLKKSEDRVSNEQEEVPGDGEDRGPKEPEERTPTEQEEVPGGAKEVYTEADGEDEGSKKQSSKELDERKMKGK